MDRRLSLQPWQTKNLDKSNPEEPEWPEESPEVSHKLDSSSDKRKSVWNWKPLRALSHIGRQRLHCVFSAYVHAIEGLPPAMNGLRLCVHMRKEETKEGAVQTMPSRVFQGIAEFQETLFMKCTLYANKGPSNTLKFMAKAFIVSVIAPDIDELDFGKHQLDLSRLLADFMDDRKGQLEKGSSWDTTLELIGKAKGGKLVITFNHEILDKDSASSGNASTRFRESPPHRSSYHTSYSLPNSAHGTPRTVTARAHLNHSPSISEPGNDYDDLLAMDHLNLDEPPPIARDPEVRGAETMEVQGFPAFRSQFEQSSMPSQDAFNAIPNFEAKLKTLSQIDQGLAPPTPSQSVEKADLESTSRNVDPVIEEEEGTFEEEEEFVVVEQGMEMDESVGNPPIDEVVEKEIDGDEKEDLDDLTPQVVEEVVEEFEEGAHEVHEDNEGKSLKEVFDGELHSISAAEEAESHVPEYEVHEDDTEKIVTVDEGEKKDNVTYQMVMQTLDSLLQGTSAKEQPQEATLEEKVGLESMTGDNLSDEEDAADKEVINVSLFPSHEEEHKTPGIELNADVYDMIKEVEEERGGNENIDSEVDLVAGEFLDMLDLGNTPLSRNSDSEPDSPRARLLKQFEQEALIQGGFGLDLEVPEFSLDEASCDADVGAASSLIHDPASKEVSSFHTVEELANWDNEDDEDLTSIMEAAKSELQRATQSMRSKTRAKMLEDAETEALMKEWGLNEKAFVSSPPKPTFRQQEPPPLGKGLGVSVPLKDGGSLRSMNPSHFQSNKSSGKLVMQVSKPVVVPAEMGSGSVDILRNMASMGIENMALQAMTAMPLEDITGRSVEQVAIEGMTAANSGHRRALEGPLGSNKELSWNDLKAKHSSQNIIDDFISLEDLAPMAMQQIEALAMDGLKIQSDIVEDDAPYALNAFSLDGQPGGKDLSAGNATLKGVTGVHLLKGAKASAETSGGDGGNGLMDMAISLDEWMLLDAGLYDEAETTKDTMAIMAAHHAIHQDIVLTGGGDDEKRKKRQSSRNMGGRWGCMGNTLTIAMLVQLRDPLKNNEAVGAPMMAFVQAERMVKPPKLKVGRNVSMKGNSEDEEAESSPQEPQFKITGVHMAGLKTSQEEKKTGWGNQKQQQTGSRWLIANGMSKNTKNHHPLLTSKSSTMASTSSGKVKVNKGESLWSISARVHGSGSKWKEMLKLNPHIRNPDVIYENQTLRTK